MLRGSRAAAPAALHVRDARGLSRRRRHPDPGIDSAALAVLRGAANNFFGLVNLFSGGALERFSIFALGIMPYISSSIILQLLTVVVPYLERLSKEGEAGAARSRSTRATARSSCHTSRAFHQHGSREIPSHPTGASVVLNPGWSFG
jgi:preprotein translocase subunit SecY